MITTATILTLTLGALAFVAVAWCRGWIHTEPKPEDTSGWTQAQKDALLLETGARIENSGGE